MARLPHRRAADRQGGGTPERRVRRARARRDAGVDRRRGLGRAFAGAPDADQRRTRHRGAALGCRAARRRRARRHSAVNRLRHRAPSDDAAVPRAPAAGRRRRAGGCSIWARARACSRWRRGGSARQTSRRSTTTRTPLSTRARTCASTARIHRSRFASPTCAPTAIAPADVVTANLTGGLLVSRGGPDPRRCEAWRPADSGRLRGGRNRATSWPRTCRRSQAAQTASEDEWHGARLRRHVRRRSASVAASTLARLKSGPTARAALDFAPCAKLVLVAALILALLRHSSCRANRVSARGIHRAQEGAGVGAGSGHGGAVRQDDAGRRRAVPPGQRLLLLHRQRGPERGVRDGRRHGRQLAVPAGAERWRDSVRRQELADLRRGQGARLRGDPAAHRAERVPRAPPRVGQRVSRRSWTRLSEADEVDGGRRDSSIDLARRYNNPLGAQAERGWLARRNAAHALSRLST